MRAIIRKELSPELRSQAAGLYATLYEKALPGTGGVDPSRLEIAGFNRSETFEEFQNVGLGLETVVIFRDEAGTGHTGKILMNLPGQLLPEHSHVDTLVLKKDAVIAEGFVKLSGLINGFNGIVKYNRDASPVLDETGRPQYLYHESDCQIVQAENGTAEYPHEKSSDVVRIFHGKSETFKAIYGDGVLFADNAQVIYTPPGVNPDVVPEDFFPMIGKVRSEQVITSRRMIHMTRGMSVLLAKNTRHAFLAGKNGCVYLEFSTPSMDEADRFSDQRIIR